MTDDRRHMREIERNISVNEPLRDGTPRTNRGFRPHVCTIGPDKCKHLGWMGRLQKRWWVGPVFRTRSEAEFWFPDAEAQKWAIEND